MISNSCKKSLVVDAGGENELAYNTVGDKRLVKRRVSTILQNLKLRGGDEWT